MTSAQTTEKLYRDNRKIRQFHAEKYDQCFVVYKAIASFANERYRFYIFGETRVQFGMNALSMVDSNSLMNLRVNERRIEQRYDYRSVYTSTVSATNGCSWKKK